MKLKRGNARKSTSRCFSIMNVMSVEVGAGEQSGSPKSASPKSRSQGSPRQGRPPRSPKGEGARKGHEVLYESAVGCAKFADHTFLAWTALIIGGIMVGFVEFLLTEVAVNLNGVKHDILVEHLAEDTRVVGSILLILFNAALALVAAFLVNYFAPICGGSGLPEMKALLNGTRVPGMLRFRTLLVKILGIALVVAAGFPVGQEGPMVHIGAIICTGIFSARIFNPHKEDEVEFDSAIENVSFQDHKGIFATIGGAAGIAAAFNAPVGGILYVFEELSTFWSPDTTFRAFACAGFAALSTQVWLYGAEGGTHLDSRVIFQVVDHRFSTVSEDGSGVEHSESLLGWTYLDFPFFIILAVVCSFVSCIYTWGGVTMNRIRKEAPWRQTKRSRMLEVVGVVTFISLIYLLVPFAFDCKDMPSEVDDDPHLEMSSWGCASTDYYNPMSTLFFGGEEGVLKQMLGPTASFVTWDPWALLVYVTLYYGLSIFSLGLSLPLGTFIPQVVTGAAIGRILGDLVHNSGIDTTLVSAPGTYAFVGAGAMLAGFTRMTVAIVVILIEASGSIGLSVPVMMSIMISRAVADRVQHPYDHQMLELKGYEFVSDKPIEGSEGLVAGDIMTKVPVLSELTEARDVKSAVDKCSEDVDAIPVSSSEGNVLVGLVSKKMLIEQLRIKVDFILEEKEGDVKKSVRRVTQLFTRTSTKLIGHNIANKGGDHPLEDVPSLMSRLSPRGGKGPTPPKGFHDEDEGEEVNGRNGDGNNDAHMEMKRMPPKGHRRASYKSFEEAAPEMKMMEIDVGDLMDRDPFAVPAYMSIGRVYQLFRRMDLRHLVVINGSGGIEGLISRHNLLVKRTKQEIDKLVMDSSSHLETVIAMKKQSGNNNSGRSAYMSPLGAIKAAIRQSPGKKKGRSPGRDQNRDIDQDVLTLGGSAISNGTKL